MSCKHDCPRPPRFPAPIHNRPGLPRIDYRIGHYALVREHLMAALDAQPALSAWTHRATDDPGIALLESDAVIADILTFYQSLYANEAWLRTAQWRESVADLVRLGGYRLAPGVAGEATFALVVKGARDVRIPAGFGLKAQLQDIDKPVEFETDHPLDAWPAFGRFALYRPRVQPPIGAGAQTLRIEGDDVALKAGQALWIAVPPSGVVQDDALREGEEAVVEETWTAFGATFVRLRAPLQRTAPIGRLRAWKLGERFRHFGHDAPDTLTTVNAQGVPNQRAISFARNARTSTWQDVAPPLEATQFALDRDIARIVPGDLVLLQGRFAAFAGGTETRATLLRRVRGVESRSLRRGSLAGAGTVLTLEQDLRGAGSGLDFADVRTLRAIEILGPAFDLVAPEIDAPGTSGPTLRHFGARADARRLAGRRLLLVRPDGATDERRVLATTPGARDPGFHDVVLSAPVPYAAFPYEGPAATVYGNLVDASQGKTIADTPIGSGDARAVFQTFAIPKAPLTWRLDARASPAQVPAIEVRVDGVRWRRVDTLYPCGPDERVYIVREETGRAAVQFGDGRTGARLPSGRNNVVAGWRVGTSAHGPLKPGTKPQATSRATGLDKVFLPLEVDTGGEPERAAVAKRAAPVRLQALGRLVAIADYEAETRMLPGVVKAGARWGAPEGLPAIVLTVLTASGSQAELVAIRDAVAASVRCRGPDRHVVRVVRGVRQFVRIRADVAHDGARTIEAMTADILQSLGAAGVEGAPPGDALDGLFGLDRRDFHADVHASEVVAAIQQVAGVRWVVLRALYPLALGVPPQVDPLQLAPRRKEPKPASALPCPANMLLSLHARHLGLSFIADADPECPR